MSARLLKSLSMAKYERLLPRIFTGAVRIDIRDRQGNLFWSVQPGEESGDSSDANDVDDPIVAWAGFGTGIEKRAAANSAAA